MSDAGDRAGAPPELAAPRRGRRSSRAACRRSPAACVGRARCSTISSRRSRGRSSTRARSARTSRTAIDALGGVDVLALDGLDDTVSPATVARARHPGRPARARARVAAHLDRAVAGALVVMRRPSVDPSFTFALSLVLSLLLCYADVHEHAARHGRRDRRAGSATSSRWRSRGAACTASRHSSPGYASQPRRPAPPRPPAVAAAAAPPRRRRRRRHQADAA